jgi:hypothetical protein
VLGEHIAKVAQSPVFMRRFSPLPFAGASLWFAKIAAGIGINNIAAGVVPAFWYNSLPCFDSSDFLLEQWFASFARSEVCSSKIWRYANNFPF